MATGELSALDSWGPASQLKIILLGGRNSGKSHVGNLLLGKEEFVTRERTLCSRRLGVVAGRWLTVVDTPGWWCDFSANDTSELVKREIVSSVSLCSPGPHVFLITIKVSSAFSEIRRRAVEEHVALLGERVWSYCMVVLISTDKHTTEAAQLVGSGGKALQWLIEKCKQRCHSIIRNDDGEVTELLQKIQKLVTENGNAVFESQGDILQKTAEEKRRVEERARQRFMRMREHRSLMRERLRPVTDIRIVLLGAKGSGKTSVLKTILSSRESSTPHSRTAQCLVGHGAVFGRQVTVVDTPGWWMNYFKDETTAFDRREMVLGLSLCPPGPHVFLLVIRVDKAFTDTYRRAAQEHLQLFGEHVWSRVIVLFTFGDWLGETTTEQHIESEGEPLQWMVEICGNRYHVLNNKTKGDGFQVRELIGKIEETLAAGCNSGDGGGLYYEMERQVMQQLVEERRGERERAEERRRRKKERQRQMARTPLEKPLPDLRIVLVGGGKTGKSSCGNTILSTDEIFTTATQTTTSCSEQGARISGRTVTVLDTPGCFSVTSDLIVTPSCALLLVVNASSSFKASQMVAIEEQLKAGKRQIWGKAVVLFSHGDCLGDTSIEQHIESEGKTLQRLVEKCGNRYHVLDNKKRGDCSQVNELLGLIEETLDEGRLAALHGGDRVWKSVSSAPDQQQMGAVARCNKGLTSRGLQLSSAVTEPAHPTTQTVTSLQHLPDNGLPQIVEAAGQTTRPTTTILERGSLLSCLASMLSGKEQLRWTVTLPAWFPTEDLQPPRRPNGESKMQLFFSPRQCPTMFVEEHVNGVSSLCHPVLRERTLQRLTRSSGGLQALLDQWGEHSGSVEELEAFIDSYFEMVWEQTMASFQPDQPEPPTELQGAGKVEEEEEVLTSIDRRLSKLELLEEIKSDLSELRKSLEQSWKAIEELKEKSKQDQNTTW